MTKSFDHLFNKRPLPPRIQEICDRIKAGDQETIDKYTSSSDGKEDDDGPPFFGAMVWNVPFRDGTMAYFTNLYSPAMDLYAVARSLAAGCMVRQHAIDVDTLDKDGGLPPLISAVGNLDVHWKVQSDLRRVIAKVPAYLKSCQPGIAGKPRKRSKRKGRGRSAAFGKSKGNGRPKTNGRSGANGGSGANGDSNGNGHFGFPSEFEVGASAEAAKVFEAVGFESASESSYRNSRSFVAQRRKKPSPETEEALKTYLPLFDDAVFVEDMMRIAVPPPGVDRFDYSTLKPRPTGHLEPAPLHRDGERIWEVSLKNGQRAFVLLFDESEPDAFVALRVLTNTALTWVDAIERGELGPDDLLPPVVPIVVYRGAELWTVPTNIREVISTRLTGLEGTHEQEYLVVDMIGAHRFAERGIPMPPDTIVRASMAVVDKDGKIAGPPIKIAFMSNVLRVPVK